MRLLMLTEKPARKPPALAVGFMTLLITLSACSTCVVSDPGTYLYDRPNGSRVLEMPPGEYAIYNQDGVWFDVDVGLYTGWVRADQCVVDFNRE